MKNTSIFKQIVNVSCCHYYKWNVYLPLKYYSPQREIQKLEAFKTFTKICAQDKNMWSTFVTVQNMV